MAWSDELKMRESDADSLLRGAQQQADGNFEEAESLFRDAFRAIENTSAPDVPVLGDELPILLRDLSIAVGHHFGGR